jgi:ribonuclease P protein component
MPAGRRRLPAAAGGSERLAPGERLRRRADFLRCYRAGRRHHGGLATLHFVPNPDGHPRLGITASRKLGRAVVRQRLKRRVREIYRRWSQRDQLPPMDLVVHLKPAAAEAAFADLERELLRLFGRLLARPADAR